MRIFNTSVSYSLSLLLVANIANAERACFKFTQDATWSEGGDLGEEFSPVVGWSTAEADNPVWEQGSQASEGIQSLAESGATTNLDSELEALIEGLRIGAYWIGRPTPSPGVSELFFWADSEYPYVHWVTMASPSPDWFLGDTVLLFENGDFVNRNVEQVKVYDAGTDDGDTFDADDAATDPRGVIDEHSGQEFGDGTANWTFVRQEDDAPCNEDSAEQATLDATGSSGAGDTNGLVASAAGALLLVVMATMA